MRKQLLFLLLLAVAGTYSFAQTFPFPRKAVTDSTILDGCMPALAQSVLHAYKNPRSNDDYYDNVFRFQLVAGNYTAALAAIDSIRASYYTPDDPEGRKSIGFQFETYAATKLYQAENHINFDSAYAHIFAGLYERLSEKTAADAAGYFESDIAALRDRLYKLLARQRNSDSIAMADARALVRTYNSYNVLKQVQPLAKPLLVMAENKLFIIEDSVLIPAAGGAVLAATVVRRRGIIEKQPAVLMLNIYTGSTDKSVAKLAALHGFAGIVVNPRGKRLSPQPIEPFEHEAEDAWYIVDWISKQPWSNQKVGTYGGSYLGFSQWAAVKKLHPALKTIIPQVAVGIGVDFPMTNHIFQGYMLQWIHFVTNNKLTDYADFNDGSHWGSVFKHWYASGRSFRSLDTLEGRPDKIFQRWLQHPSYDSFWQQMVPYKQDFAAINIPVLTTTGYYDDDQMGALYYYRQHHLFNKQANHYLVIGPWDHGGAQSQPSSTLMGYPIDETAKVNIDELAYQWFNYILKDSARPALLKDHVNYEVMGANEWRHAPSMDKMNRDTLRFYLGAIRTGAHYKLTKHPGPLTYIQQEVDFADRSDTSHENSNSEQNLLITTSIAPRESISFITDAFQQPVIVNGAFLGALQAKLNKKDMDIKMALYELMPDGRYFYLSHYIGRASYAKSNTQRQLLQPGKINTIPFSNSSFTSRLLQKGSRLVLCLGIVKSAGRQINYGTGKDVSDETIADGKIPLQIQWFTNSYIKIPVQWQ